MVPVCEIRQQFPEIVGKIGIIRKPKALSSLNKIASRDAVNPNFSRGKYSKHSKQPLTRALGTIWPDHQSKADDGLDIFVQVCLYVIFVVSQKNQNIRKVC